MTTKHASLVPWIAGGLLLLGSACVDQPTAGGADGGAAGGVEWPWTPPGSAGTGSAAGSGGRAAPRFPRWPGFAGRGGSGEAAGAGGSEDADAGLHDKTVGADTATGSVVIGR